MGRAFIFDVDGTLTPSRGRIIEDFRLFFANFCSSHHVYIVTGSDREKTLEQLGSYIIDNCVKRVYQCSGSDVWENGNNIRTSSWVLPEAAHEWLSVQLGNSKFRLRTGNHFDYRPGLCNFSVLGRGATISERSEYVDYDRISNERERIATYFNCMFPTLSASIAGETGLDITPLGANKSQILSDFDLNDEIVFFGDATYQGGNDFEISQSVLDRRNSKCYSVSSWKETWQLLRETVNN